MWYIDVRLTRHQKRLYPWATSVLPAPRSVPKGHMAVAPLRKRCANKCAAAFICYNICVYLSSCRAGGWIGSNHPNGSVRPTMQSTRTSGRPCVWANQKPPRWRCIALCLRIVLVILFLTAYMFPHTGTQTSKAAEHPGFPVLSSKAVWAAWQGDLLLP